MVADIPVIAMAWQGDDENVKW